MHIRTYGVSGPVVFALHGGPAAVGHAAPIARGLADTFRAVEPWQRGSGGEPLTVARHVADLHDLILARQDAARPAIVGHSWGAMLALAYAAEHPDAAGPLVLVGCGTFDAASRARFVELRDQRTTDEHRCQVEHLEHDCADAAERFVRKHELTMSIEDYAPLPPGPPDPDVPGSFDMQAHAETWSGAMRLQSEGVHPAAFRTIESPVLMLHGDYDPHPGRMIRDGLAPHIPQLEYHELARCGHSPWNERFARDEFFAVMRAWLLRHT